SSDPNWVLRGIIGNLRLAPILSRSPAHPWSRMRSDPVLGEASGFVALCRKRSHNRAIRHGSTKKGRFDESPLFQNSMYKRESYAARADSAGSFRSVGSGNGAVFHFLSSGITCLAKHLMFRSASSKGIPA